MICSPSTIIMAVKLVRAEFVSDNSDEKSDFPTIQIRNKEVKAPEYLKGRVTGRTNEVFTSDGHQRQLVWQNNFTRRLSQLTDGGFHGSPGRNYTEIGDVILDDSTLILQALGQEKKQPLEAPDNKHGTTEHTVRRGPPPILRSRTPSQFPDQLKSLHSELHHSNTHLSKIRKGHGLFHLIKKEAHINQQNIDTKAELEKEQNQIEWKEAVGSDSTHELIVSTENGKAEEINSDSEIQCMYRLLCVIKWVLDCMKLESPHYMPAIGTYWRVTHPQIINGKRIYERQQTMLKKWEEMSMQETGIHSQNRKDFKKDGRSCPVSQSRNEEERIRKQRNLTPEQFEKLKVIVDEELNRSKKKAHMKIKEMMQESALKYRRHKSFEKKSECASTEISVELTKVLFGKVDESHRMITHEQLTVMSRDRQDALEQRFSSLSISGNMWKDIDNMRSGVKIESTAMAHNKLMMNYNWISDLKKMLSDEVCSNKYCKKILHQLCVQQEYMRSVGPTMMSQEKLMNVIGTLYPWQLESPEVTKAIEFIIKYVIFVVPEDYQKWTEYNFGEK